MIRASNCLCVCRLCAGYADGFDSNERRPGALLFESVRLCGPGVQDTPESACPPAALSTLPKRTPPRSEAFRKGANDYNFFATVDYAHIPECYWKPPQPPAEHIFADTERLGECHNGCVRQVTAQEAGQWGQQAEERPGAIPPAGRGWRDWASLPPVVVVTLGVTSKEKNGVSLPPKKVPFAVLLKST